jgi:hypothetical protein
MSTPPSVISKLFFESRSPIIEQVGADMCDNETLKKKMFSFSFLFWGFDNFDQMSAFFPEIGKIPFVLQGQRRQRRYIINRKYFYRQRDTDKVTYTFIINKILGGQL